MTDNQNIKTFLASIEGRDTTTRIDLFEIESIDTGGSIQSPKRLGLAAIHVYEIFLHGLFMTGTTMSEAMMKWERTAKRCLLDETDGVLV